MAPASSAAWRETVMRERCSGGLGCFAARLPGRGAGGGGGGGAHGGEDSDRSDGEGAAIAQVMPVVPLGPPLPRPHRFWRVAGLCCQGGSMVWNAVAGGAAASRRRGRRAAQVVGEGRVAGAAARGPSGRVIGIIRRNWRTRGYAGSIQPGKRGSATTTCLFCPVGRKFPLIRLQTRQVLHPRASAAHRLPPLGPLLPLAPCM